MLKICHIITTFYDTAGSSQRTLLEVNYQISIGYTVHLIVGKDASNDLIKECISKGIKVFQIDSLLKYINVKAEIKALLTIVKILKEQKYDLVHTHLAKGGILGRVAAKITGINVIIHTVHGPSFPGSKKWFQRFLFLYLEKIVGRFTDAMIFVGKEIKDDYVQKKVITPDRAYVIYTGRDFSRYDEAITMSSRNREIFQKENGVSVSDIVIGYVARLVPSKGHLLAIQACKALINNYPNLKMLFIGEANLPSEQHYQEMLQNKIKELALEDTILFLGHQHEIAKFYAIMDVFILSSHYEGLPNVVVEAVLMGLPIVAFDCGGVNEVLDMCPNSGYVVQFGDLQAFISKLKDVINEISFYRNHGRKCTDTIKRIWNIDKMLNETHKLYEVCFKHSNLSLE